LAEGGEKNTDEGGQLGRDCNEDEKVEGKKSQEIVEKVKQTEDLSSYEKRLLSCIVDDSEFLVLWCELL
jgi:hypothetical protein